MATTITLKAVGLNTDPNQLEVQEGSLIEAKNVIIKRDNVIEPARGYKLFGESFGSSSDRVKQMWEYKDRIIRHYGSTLQFQNGLLNSGVVNFDTFAGTYDEPRPGYRIKHVDANGNLYFTTAEGIKKLSAKVASDFLKEVRSIGSPSIPLLGSSGNMAVLASSTITNTGFSVLTGDLGLSPGTSVTGFPPGTVSGIQHINDGVSIQAQTDLTTAYTSIVALTGSIDKSGLDLGTLTLIPGIYSYSSSAQLTGTLVLDAKGDPNAVWIFKIGSTLTTASSSVVSIVNGGSAGNVFWQVGSSATLGTSTTFNGNILANTSITLNTSATINGRALARNGAVTLDTNIISIAPSTNQVGLITDAGGIKAVDFTARLKVVLGDQSSFLPQDSAVAYRIVWGTKDANGIFIEGTPSQRQEVYNPMSELIVRDVNNLLLNLDRVSNTTPASLINDGDYVSSLQLPLTATVAEIRNSLVILAGKLDADILYGNDSGSGVALNINTATSVFINNGIYTINFSSGNPSTYFVAGDRINLTGFGVMDGIATISSTTSTSLSVITTKPDSIAEVETIKTVADVASSLNNKYFFIDQVGGNGYYVWFNVGGAGVDPGPFGSRTAVPVAIAVNANAAAIASAISVALNSLSGSPYAAVVNNDTITLTHTVAGEVTGMSDAGTTTFTLNVTTYGANSTVVTSLATITSGTFGDIPQPPVPDVPTPNQQLVVIQDYLTSILTSLQLEPITVITAASQSAFLANLDITKTASVILTITIPDGVTSNYFYQIYRSDITRAVGTTTIQDIIPNDELQLVYESYPTTSELASRSLSLVDITPDEFRGANLYTNSATGEGILQANDVPPFALDINRFKNVVFYANTRTRHRMLMSLLGVQEMIDSYNAGGRPSISIVSQDGTVNTYYFVTGQYEITQIVCNAGSTLAATGPGSYFNINSGEDEHKYYVWYQLGANTDPAIAGRTGIQVVASTTDTNSVIAQKTTDTLLAYAFDFGAAVATNTISVVTIKPGYTTDSVDGTTGFTITTPQQGRGENSSTKEILLSPNVSVGTAVDETSRSLVRLINANTSDIINAYYTSSSNDVPGKFYFEARNLQDFPFYVIGNNGSTGISFNPDISNTFDITNISTGSTVIITTSAPNTVINNERVVLSLTNSTPSIDGAYIAKYIDSTHFSIEVSTAVTIAGTSGVGVDESNAAVSEDEAKPNRIYYSKKDQPEAVPLVNYLDVGDSNKEILRIFPLRDSLFVFKENGLYRISGEVAPFTVALFDSSVGITGPDTLDVSNNVLYCLTTQGITEVTEGGTSAQITNPIQSDIKKVVVIPNYKNISFGMGYESDNSYMVWLPTSPGDVNATIGYRYSTKTNSWTNLIRDTTIGFINPTDDKMYMGCGDTNYIEQERKDFERTDYSGREYSLNLGSNNTFGTMLKLANVSNINIGDVLVQNQDLTVYEFNMLLKKLDIDTGIADPTYYSTLSAVAGDNLRDKINALATKLDADLSVGIFSAAIGTIGGSISSISAAALPIITTASPHGLVTGRYVSFTGTNSTPLIDGNYLVTVTGTNTFTIPFNVDLSGTGGSFVTLNQEFRDIKGSYNEIIDLLNADSTVSFSNYHKVDNQTSMEAIVVSRNLNRNEVTLNLALDFIVGPITQFASIEQVVTYAPNLFGDPINYKHIREATIMFISKAFTSAQLSFFTDLLPEFMDVNFNADSNGIFGHQNFGTGFFGGASNAAPFRTYIPRQCQRCRYIVTRFTHKIARETFGIYGVTLTGENTQSSRAYRG